MSAVAIASPGLAQLIAAIPSLSRSALEGLVDRAIEYMDSLDPDPDLEPNGDELDYTGAEDEPFSPAFGLARQHGPGCPIADPA